MAPLTTPFTLSVQSFNTSNYFTWSLSHGDTCFFKSGFRLTLRPLAHRGLFFRPRVAHSTSSTSMTIWGLHHESYFRCPIRNYKIWRFKSESVCAEVDWTQWHWWAFIVRPLACNFSNPQLNHESVCVEVDWTRWHWWAFIVRPSTYNFSNLGKA
jgi:hypothetical protein